MSPSTIAETHKATVLAWLTAFHQSKAGADRKVKFLETFAPDVTIANGSQLQNMDQHLAMTEDYEKAFGEPETWKTEIQSIVADEQQVAVRYLVTCEQTGDFAGIPATHKVLPFPSVMFCQMNQDGKVKEAQMMIDVQAAISAAKED